MESNTKVFSAEEFTAIKNLVANYFQKLIEAKGELRTMNESVNDTLAGDSELNDVDDQIKQLHQKRASILNRIKVVPSFASLIQKRKDQAQEIKEIKGALDNYLLQFYKITGTQEFESLDGEVLDYAMKSVIGKLSSKTRIRKMVIPEGQVSMIN